jgi:hypothetical protein
LTMEKRLSKDEVILLIARLMNGEGTEKEADEMISVLKQHVPDPNVSNLIFWSDEEYTPEEIYEKAMSYKPIQL